MVDHDHWAAVPDWLQVGEAGAVPEVATSASAMPMTTDCPLLFPAVVRRVNPRGVARVRVFAARTVTTEMARAFAADVVTSGLGVRVAVAPAMPDRSVAVAWLGLGG